MKRDSSYAIYFSAGNPVATTNPSVYKVVDDAKYTSQNTPAYAWAGFLNALVSNIGAELPQIDIVVESLVVEDMIRDELAQLKYKVETKSMPAELQQALIDFEKTYLKVNPKVIEVTEIDIFRKQAELLKQEFEDELAITKTTSPWDTKKIQYLEQKLARLTTVTETLSTEQSQRVMREITSINNTLNKAGVNLNELTGLKSEIVKVQASITSLRSYTITPDVTRELDKQEALLKDLATLLGKKTELLQNTNEITRLQQLIAKRERKDPVTKESYAKKVKTLEKANITLEADVATLQGKAYTPVAPIPKQK
ncbi:MAG: hypothetical protein Q8O99_05140 [bacterium]|nr:hypothetical protein [bacterium]